MGARSRIANWQKLDVRQLIYIGEALRPLIGEALRPLVGEDLRPLIGEELRPLIGEALRPLYGLGGEFTPELDVLRCAAHSEQYLIIISGCQERR